MSVFRFIFVFFSLVHLSLYAEKISQPYSIDMVTNSHKYIDYAYLANRVYDENTSNIGKIKTISGKSWELYWYQSEKDGFQGAVYRNYGKWVVAIGGTTASPSNLSTIQKWGETGRDIVADVRLLLLSNLVPTTQADKALKFIQDIQDDGIIIDAIVGHSLGGGLAAYAGLYYDIKTVTFNTSPIPFTKKSIPDFIKNHSITLPYGSLKWGKKFAISYAHSDKITNIMSADDPLTHRLNMPLIDWDNKAFNATNPLTRLNIVKSAMFLPIQMKLNYIMAGKNIELDINTGHSIAKMLEKMKDAKRIDEWNKWDAINTYYTDKLKKLDDSKYMVHTYQISNYGEKASMNSVLVIMRYMYAKIKKISLTGSPDTWDDDFTYDKFIISLGLKDTDLAKRLNDSIKGDISYKEYMLIAEAVYRKIFGGQVFFSNLRRKSKMYLVYDDKRAKYASAEMNRVYGHIFLLHGMAGTPKKYLQNEDGAISNGFVINFLDRFLDVLVTYKSKIK